MLKNCNGFSVLEVLVSFSILLVLSTIIIPVIMKTYEERTVLDYKREALVLLHNETEAFLYDNQAANRTKEITQSERTYLLIIEPFEQLVRLCVQWEVPWKKKGKVCDYAKR